MTASNVLSQLGSPGVSTGFKNRIINGAMVIDQRNAGASVTVTSDGQYTLDRFRMSVSQSSKFTIQRSTTAPSGFSNSMLITVASAVTPSGSDYFGVLQAIEGFNVADLGFGTASAQTVTLSFWVRSSLTGTFSGMLYNNAANRSYCFTYTINTANTFEYKTVTIAGDTTGTWTTDNTVGLAVYWDLGSGISTGTSGSWQSTIVRRTSSSVQLVATSGATLYIAGVQLEVGTTATNFEVRDYGRELILCQRYYQIVDINGSPLNLYPGSGNGYACAFLPVEMRTNPSFTFDTSIAASGAIYWNGGSITATYAGNQPSTSRSVSFLAARSSGVFAAGEVCGHTYVRVRTSAEL